MNTMDDSLLNSIRPHQQQIRAYRSGLMGISAVPGSGKTFTLSLLASDLLAENLLNANQEILIVTLVNAAVDNFYQRINAFIHFRGLMPNLGYRVRTLHGLAHDIVRERPDMAGLDNRFEIIDEREAQFILKDSVLAWRRSHPYGLDEYISGEIAEYQAEKVRRDLFPETLESMAANFIRYAKDLEFSPHLLEEYLAQRAIPMPLAQFGSEIFTSYQRALAYRGAVDFDDLTRLALVILRNDPLLVDRLRSRWPYILEDEAQDSSQLQESLLGLLAGADQNPPGNWVRVGDPNQAVYETFTTADPRYLRAFIQREDVQSFTLPTSSRSTPSIIGLANHLVGWCTTKHPIKEIRDALHAPPWLQPVDPDDPYPNPADEPGGIRIVQKNFTAQDEILAVVDSLEKWLPDHPDWTVAVLVPRNARAFTLVDELRKRKIDCVDNLLRSSASTRLAAGSMTHILRYLVDPLSPAKLSMAYRVWRRDERANEETALRIGSIADIIKKINRVEDFLFPSETTDWLLENIYDQDIQEELEAFRTIARRWVSAVTLPIDQLILMLAQDFLTQPADLAIAHKLAVLMRRTSQDHPEWRIRELTEELAVIARNERRFLGFSGDDSGFDPGRYRGRVVVATLHKAKGLEWDRVYIMSASNYDFPSGQEYDSYISEKWFIRDRLNMEAEALRQLDVLRGVSQSVENSTDCESYLEGEATKDARLDYIRERIRLLYVGITRARKELIVTWNTGRQGKSQIAIPVAFLSTLDMDTVADLPLPHLKDDDHDQG